MLSYMGSLNPRLLVPSRVALCRKLSSLAKESATASEWNFSWEMFAAFLSVRYLNDGNLRIVKIYELSRYYYN